MPQSELERKSAHRKLAIQARSRFVWETMKLARTHFEEGWLPRFARRIRSGGERKRSRGKNGPCRPRFGNFPNSAVSLKNQAVAASSALNNFWKMSNENKTTGKEITALWGLSWLKANRTTVLTNPKTKLQNTARCFNFQ